MFDIIQVTAQYSNAVLIAIMPHISDFSKKLDLPIPQPVTAAQVRHFGCSPRTDLIGGKVVLTNGYEFTFLHGRVEMYRSPQSYYELKDPDQFPRFLGTVKLKEKEALQVAHVAIKRLGYTDSLLHADRPPQVKPPPKIGKNCVPRYKIRWIDDTRGSNPADPPTSVEFEVDAATGQIQMMLLFSPDTWRPDPQVNVHPPVITQGPKTVYRGGRTMIPVSQAYSNAFLVAILPQCGQYAKTAGFPVRLPITTSDVDMAHYSLGLIDADPCAFLDLKTGERFVYRHGQVIAFYAADVMQLPGREAPPFPTYEQFQKRFYGPINMTTNEAVALVRQTIRKLGYSEKDLHMDEPPRIGGPNRWGTNFIARCILNWQEPDQGAFRAVAEVDMARKALKSLYINDHANTTIWRTPPKIGVPAESPAADPQTEPPPGSGQNKPPPTKL